VRTEKVRANELLLIGGLGFDSQIEKVYLRKQETRSYGHGRPKGNVMSKKKQAKKKTTKKKKAKQKPSSSAAVESLPSFQSTESLLAGLDGTG